MKRFSLLTLAAALVIGASAGYAQEDEVAPVRAAQGPTGLFADTDGDGINDNAPNSDGDGVINHLDDDYAPQGAAHGRGARGQFIDENGDGLNDLAPDDDGDGVPNGQDSDYVRPANGGRQQMVRGGKGGNGQMGRGTAGSGVNFIDADGDGINDEAPDSDGDGTINCLDDDYVPQRAGRGKAVGGRNGIR